jgi:lysozyme family protein
VAFVIDRLEGGDSPVTDSGGPTRWGISQRAHPDVDVAHLTRADAEAIYRTSYWEAVTADLLPGGLALLVFDAAVNMGVRQAIGMLQRILRVPEDREIGPVTRAAARAFRPPSELRALYNELRLRTYEEIVATKPTYRSYLYGWRCRVMRLADEAGRWGDLG